MLQQQQQKCKRSKQLNHINKFTHLGNMISLFV